jgi:DNA polymerase-3 subunit alpha
MFQIESQLGKMLAKKLKPENIEHLSALVAIMRPGVLESEIDGKSITNHYIDRKNKISETTYLTPYLEPILKDTFGCLIYQEQILAIARALADFTLQEADELRRGVGKKKPEIISKCKKLFKEKAKIKGLLTEEEADTIFDWIEKSQRYSFNKSHSISYAYTCYLTAYAKAHFPRGFMTSYLRYAKDKTATKKSNEIKELVNDAKSLNIVVKGPDVRLGNINFILRDKEIYFGISNISGIGEKAADTILENSAKLNLNNITWPEYLFKVGQYTNSKAFENLIECGAIDFIGISRNQMLLEYKQFCDLTEKEISLIEGDLNSSENSLLYYLEKLVKLPTGRNGIASEKRRIKLRGLLDVIKNPPRSTRDTAEWISGVEEAKLGVNITASKLDDNHSAKCANTSCVELNNGSKKDYVLLACVVKRIKETTIKKGASEGRQMAFLTVEDETGIYESVVAFSDVWEANRSTLLPDNTVMLGGEMKKNRDVYSLIVQQVFQI